MKPQCLVPVPGEGQLVSLQVTQVLLVSVLQTLRTCFLMRPVFLREGLTSPCVALAEGSPGRGKVTGFPTARLDWGASEAMGQLESDEGGGHGCAH